MSPTASSKPLPLYCRSCPFQERQEIVIVAPCHVYAASAEYTIHRLVRLLIVRIEAEHCRVDALRLCQNCPKVPFQLNVPGYACMRKGRTCQVCQSLVDGTSAHLHKINGQAVDREVVRQRCLSSHQDGNVFWRREHVCRRDKM